MFIVNDSSNMSPLRRLLIECFFDFNDGEIDPFRGLEIDLILDYLDAANGDRGLVLPTRFAYENGVSPCTPEIMVSSSNFFLIPFLTGDLNVFLGYYRLGDLDFSFIKVDCLGAPSVITCC